MGGDPESEKLRIVEGKRNKQKNRVKVTGVTRKGHTGKLEQHMKSVPRGRKRSAAIRGWGGKRGVHGTGKDTSYFGFPHVGRKEKRGPLG